MNLDIEKLHKPLKVGRRSGRTTDLVFHILGIMYFMTRKDSAVYVVVNRMDEAVHIAREVLTWDYRTDYVEDLITFDKRSMMLRVVGKGCVKFISDEKFQEIHRRLRDHCMFLLDHNSKFYSLNENDYTDKEIRDAIQSNFNTIDKNIFEVRNDNSRLG